MPAEARKRQIVHVALKTIGKYGVQGVTIARIANAAGVTTGILCTRFENRRAILLAALDAGPQSRSTVRADLGQRWISRF